MLSPNFFFLAHGTGAVLLLLLITAWIAVFVWMCILMWKEFRRRFGKRK